LAVFGAIEDQVTLSRQMFIHDQGRCPFGYYDENGVISLFDLWSIPLLFARRIKRFRVH
jgi:hypothetical protein